MITVLTGKNSYNLGLKLNLLIESARAELGDFGVERFDASETDVDTILQAVQSLPFLAPKKLIVIDKTQSNNILMDRMTEVINRTPEEVDLVLVGPIFDKRKTSFGLLKKHASILEFAEADARTLPTWIVDIAKNQGAKISTKDATYLVERVGVNQLLLASEIIKMSLYTQNITKETIDKLTDQSSQSSVFSLLDAAFAGDSKKALKMYRQQREQKVDPHYIVAMLTWQLHGLALAVFAEPQTEATLVNAGQTPYLARKSLALSKRVSKADLRNFVSELNDLDMQIKTNTDGDAALELYLLSLKN